MKWQPIATAPKFTPVLIHWSVGLGYDGTTEVAMLGEWWSDAKAGALVKTEWGPVSLDHSGFRNKNPTHWMALPEWPE